MKRLTSLATLAAALPALALAQITAEPPTVGRGSDLVVHAKPPVDPRVISTFPADGGKAPGGIVVLKIVFDQAMVPEAWSYGAAPDGAFPHCLKKPRLLPDQKSFALLCSVAPDLGYAIQINASPDFVSARGRSAQPFMLHFKTTSDTVYDMYAALKQAGLTDADEPIMTWNAQPGGVSDAAPPAPSNP
ncbi:MAG TPA: hypothetical protein VMU59_01955 [Caulobacteraceae bacterium]|nr:hypothetical protein [Caulobacteraceae bacterium]